MPTWLKHDEAARYLEVEPAELRQLIADGSGPRYYRKGPLVRFRMDDLDSWVDEQFADETPETSEGWEAVEAGTISAAGETKADLHDLYGEKPTEVPAPQEVVSRLVDAGGQPLDPVNLRLSTRGQMRITDDFGTTHELGDPADGMPEEALAGVDATPPHVVKACEEDDETQRKIISARLKQPAAR